MTYKELLKKLYDYNKEQLSANVFIWHDELIHDASIIININDDVLDSGHPILSSANNLGDGYLPCSDACKNLTFEKLISVIGSFNEEQLNADVTIFVKGEFFPATLIIRQDCVSIFEQSYIE